jgi:hypothetical protein
MEPASAPTTPAPKPGETEEQARLRRARKTRAVADLREKKREESGDTSYMKRAATLREKRKRAEITAAETDRKRQAKVELMRRAIELYGQGVPKSRIATQLDRSVNTISFWLRDIPKPVVEDKPDPIQQALAMETSEAVASDFLAARDEEESALVENAKAQNSPADQYQAYVAANAIRMLRDSFQSIRGPRTVRELSELDQLIRRNLGLNPRGGNGGGGGLTIDISILNNTKATPRTGIAVALDAEEAEP